MHFPTASSINFRWCAKSTEMGKCQEFIKYVSKTATKKGIPVTDLSCVNGSTSDICMTFIKDDKADLVTLDGGRVYEAGTSFVCQVLAKFSRVGPSWEKEKEKCCVVFMYSEVDTWNYESFMSEPCNDNLEMYEKRDTCTVFLLIETYLLFVILVAVAVVVA